MAAAALSSSSAAGANRPRGSHDGCGEARWGQIRWSGRQRGRAAAVGRALHRRRLDAAAGRDLATAAAARRGMERRRGVVRGRGGATDSAGAAAARSGRRNSVGADRSGGRAGLKLPISWQLGSHVDMGTYPYSSSRFFIVNFWVF
ncbi:hypothetical protein BRADI_2g35182v3 [Brachypodium distachyon]|uniref:Uncharacterized protein n=1 Tax=Brachypodium distachyon TaxID=15368 RepID=A0A0Q3MSW2_BRADI|nr:hypothetical protein BRADI_2g35182v3 [Brachypodium distachyon]